MINNPKISVLVPFFGAFDPRRLELAISSTLQAEKDEKIEFLICTGKEAIPLGNAVDITEIVRKAQEIRGDPSKVISKGSIYNQGIKKVQGDYVYLSDSDIIFPEHFFSGLIQASESANSPLYRPMMRRLLLQDFETFYLSYLQNGIRDSLKSLDFSQEFIVKPDKNPRDIRVFKKFENGRMKTFIVPGEDYEEYISNPSNRGSEPKFFNQDRHCGATFAKRKQLEDIGGCCEEFKSWGCWDADLQWKLKDTYGLSYIPGEVIHLDHPKGYFDRERWKLNRLLQETRRAKGAIKCIQEDREVYAGQLK